MMVRFTYLIFATLFLALAVVGPRGAWAVSYSCNETIPLTAVAKGTLPIAMYNTRASWDGLYNIYLFGGKDANGNKLDSIYSYSLLTSTVTKVSKVLPSARYSGVVLKDWLTPNLLPSFYYMGVNDLNSSTDPIYKYNPILNQVTTVGSIQTVTEGLASAETADHMAYIFGGPNYPWADVSTFDMSSGAVNVISELKVGLPSVGTAVYYPTTGNITIVGSAVAGSYRDSRVLGYKMDTMASDLTGTIKDLPDIDHAAVAVDSSEDHMWIIGGYQYWEYDDITGIYQINLTSYEPTFLSVAGFPSVGEMWFSSSSAVWVSRGYKIFFFGGLMRNSSLSTTVPGVAMNNIWMIDMTPQYCCGKSNGLFPHPDDCKKFIQCLNGVTSILSCPLPLQWDVVNQVCSLAQGLVCTVSGILNG